MKVVGGKPFYGEAIGILMFDNKRYPIAPGSVGNACSNDFPVRMKVIPGIDNNPFPPIRVNDGELAPEVRAAVQAVKEMEADGVRAIAMCCGFYALIQDVLAEAVDIPVFSSPLMMIPSILQMLGKGKSVCVMTASKRLLSPEFFEAVGVTEEMPVVVAGLDDSEEFNTSHMGGTSIEMDVDQLRSDVVDAVQEAIEADASIGAVLLECATLPIFAADIQHATGLPVFDYNVYIDMLYRAVVPKRYQGFL
jgi:Asp/Glu/hydantoin racemase